MINPIVYILNCLDYPLRNIIKWRRKGLLIKNEDKTNLFYEYSNQKKLDEKENYYKNEYQLQALREKSSIKIYLQNLYYLDVLERIFGKNRIQLDDNLIVADIGVSDWFYVYILKRFYERWKTGNKRRVQLDGYEIDPFRVYNDLYSRFDYAEKYSDGLENVNYFPEGFVAQKETYQVITQFFPFITMNQHTRWGLPFWKFNPDNLLKEIYNSLVNEGLLLIVNQGLREYEIQKELIRNFHFKIIDQGEINSKFYQYSIERYFILAEKNG